MLILSLNLISVSQSYDLGDFMSTSTTEELQESVGSKAFYADHMLGWQMSVMYNWNMGIGSSHHLVQEILDKAAAGFASKMDGHMKITSAGLRKQIQRDQILASFVMKCHHQT